MIQKISKKVLIKIKITILIILIFVIVVEKKNISKANIKKRI